MMIIIGLFLIIPIILIIVKATNIKTTKLTKVLLDILLFFISVIFIILCFLYPSEPYIFTILEPTDYILYSAVIYLFTPFMWIITFYYMRNILKNLRVKKNGKLKDKNRFEYYRDDLDKVSPNTIMFTSIYDVDYKKSIASTILKLKLTGHLEEKRKKLVVTDKDTSSILDSEKMILDLIRTNELDKIKYRKTIENETISNKYVKKNSKIFITIIKIILVILINITMYKASFKLDRYVFENYHIMTEKKDNKQYIKLEIDEDIEKLHNEVKDETVYYGEMFDYTDGRRMSYNYTKVRTDALEYSVVRKAIILNILVPISILLCIISSFIVLYIIIDLLININKKYRRTLKGKELLNKTYALKNFLKDFSLIKNRTEEELILWNYYLVYATVLGINKKIDDEVINKYVK